MVSVHVVIEVDKTRHIMCIGSDRYEKMLFLGQELVFARLFIDTGRATTSGWHEAVKCPTHNQGRRRIPFSTVNLGLT